MGCFVLCDNMHGMSSRTICHPSEAMNTNLAICQKTSMFFFLVETASALVEGSFCERFCPTSSSAEDAVDFFAKRKKKTIVFEQPCFVNKYWFCALDYYRNWPTF